MRELEALEDDVPGAAHARLADASRSAATFSTDFAAGRAPRADAQPRQRLLRRGARGLGARGSSATPARPAPLPVRAQGRRPRRSTCVYESGRLVRAADPRRRPHRRGRHRQRPHHRGRPAPARPATSRARAASRCAARSSSRSRRFADAQRRAWSRRARRRSPTRATPPPARCGRRTRGSPRPGRCGMVVHGIGAREGFDADRASPQAYDALRGLGPAGSATATGWSPTSTRCRRYIDALRRAPARRRARDRRRRGQGRRGRAAAPARLDLAGRRAGRSPSSTRPRRSTPSCSTSRSTSAAPAGSRRSA